ncbi:Hypothetical_protein [Hexamita inflata]|uniref:Hypothetical_protein n=1 Tax=Hexamita inflata TaxID=28002 RepID=A0AA86PWX3_9EUKA|nr:Hypothetical protein HINF_LOCUS30172 [Hexamita inflata]
MGFIDAFIHCWHYFCQVRSGNTDKLNIISFQQNQQHKINLSTQLIFDRILTKTVVQLKRSYYRRLYQKRFHNRELVFISLFLKNGRINGNWIHKTGKRVLRYQLYRFEGCLWALQAQSHCSKFVHKQQQHVMTAMLNNHQELRVSIYLKQKERKRTAGLAMHVRFVFVCMLLGIKKCTPKKVQELLEDFQEVTTGVIGRR